MSVLKKITLCLMLTMSVMLYAITCNVRDFGAKGDGKTDDTLAFQKAFKAAFVPRDNNNISFSTPEVFVPAGRYLLKDTLVFFNNLVMRGEKGSVLIQPDPKKDLLYGHPARFGFFENLTFSGGRTQIHIWTENNDASIFSFKNCRFENSSAFAVKSFDFATGGGPLSGQRANNKLVAPYHVIEKDGRFELIDQDVSRFKKGEKRRVVGHIPHKNKTVVLDVKKEDCFHYFNSTKIQIEDSVFDNCGGALACETDGTTVRRCRITTNRNSTLPVFILGNRSTLAELDILVRRNPTLSQAVVGFYGSLVGAGPCLDFNSSRICTDNGKGVCLIHADMTNKTYFAQSILLRNLEIESAGCPEGAIIYFKNDTFCNMAVLENVRENGKGKVKALAFDKEPDQNSIRRSFPLHYEKRANAKQSFVYSFLNNSSNIDTTLPAALKQFEKKLPKATPLPQNIAPKLTFKGKVFYAEKHGVGRIYQKKDTVNLQKLLDLAGKTPGSTVVLPARDFLLEKTLRVPRNIHITSAGMTRFKMRHTREDIFLLHSPEAVRFSKLSLCNARIALNIKAPAGHKGRVELDACSGWDLNKAAVVARIGNNSFKDGKNMELYFHDGVWLVQTAYIGNLNAVIDSLWLESKRYNSRMPFPIWVAFESVVFVNYGKLQLTDLLSVPMVFRKAERNKLPPKDAPEGDHRWVDNYGEFISFNCRFGTEFFGHALIYHYGKAKTRIYGGFGGFMNPRALRYPGLVDTPDADFEIQNFVVSPYGKEKRVLIYQDETGKRTAAPKRNFYNIIPEDR